MASTNKSSTIGKTAGVTGVAAAIIAAVFALEGGYTNNPKDPGGATNHGVTEQVARKHGYEGHMRDLDKEWATSIYYKDYIEKPGYVPLLTIQPVVAEKLIDGAVNAGPGRASRWFQTGLNALNRDGKDYPDLVVDGSFGPRTVAAYEGLERVRGKVKACELMLKVLDIQQGSHYLSLTNLETFTVGWIDNRIGHVDPKRCSQANGGFHVSEQ